MSVMCKSQRRSGNFSYICTPLRLKSGERLAGETVHSCYNVIETLFTYSRTSGLERPQVRTNRVTFKTSG